jgi:uncharacterized protein YndB with AHSA1/START domain
MNDYGELLDDSTVRFERLLPGPIERVWEYIVESDKRAKWLCAGDIGAGDGAHVDMRFHNETLSNAEDIERPEKYRDMPNEISFTGSVTRWDPPHVVSHTWDFEDESSEVCYELEEVGDKVRLVLTHRRLESGDKILSVSGGWHTHLDILVDVLEGHEPGAFWKKQTALEAEYTARLGL